MLHNKLHKSNHHTFRVDENSPDSGLDCIASLDEPFQGDFVVQGTFSSVINTQLPQACFVSNDISTAVEISATHYSLKVYGDVDCVNTIYVDSITLTDDVVLISPENVSSTNLLLQINDKTDIYSFRLWSIPPSPV